MASRDLHFLPHDPINLLPNIPTHPTYKHTLGRMGMLARMSSMSMLGRMSTLGRMGRMSTLGRMGRMYTLGRMCNNKDTA